MTEYEKSEAGRVEQMATEEQVRELVEFIPDCLANDVRFTLEFETGRYSDQRTGEVTQGDKGFKILVGQYGFTDKNTGNDMLYPTLGWAVKAGKELLAAVVAEKK